MKTAYLKRVVYLIGLSAFFLYLIIRVAVDHSPEEEKKAGALLAKISLAQSGIRASSEFQFSFYHLLAEGDAAPIGSKKNQTQDFYIETGTFHNEKQLEIKRKRLAAMGYSVIKRQIGKSRWVLEIGRFESSRATESEIAKLGRLRLPRPLKAKAN